MNWDGSIPMSDHVGNMIDICHRIIEGKCHELPQRTFN